MRRLLVPSLVIFMLILSACGSSTGTSSGGGGVNQQGLTSGNSYIACPGSTNTTATAPESGTVTLNVAGWSSSPAEDALVRQNLNNFEQSHPNIKVNWSLIPGDYPTKMRANVAAGNLPDVFYLQPTMSSEYISSGKLLNLSPYMAKDNVSASEYISSGKLLNLSPYMAKDNVSASDYYAALMNPFTCKSGQVFGIPKDWNSLGVFYNKQMFQAAGLSAPSPNWTWSDFQADAQKLTKNPGSPKSVYGVVLSADASRWGAFLLANGGTVLNQDGSQAAFNNSAGISTTQFYDSFLKNNTGALPTTVGAPWNGDAFGKQRAAMAIEGGWLIPYMAQSYPGVQYGIAPLPVAPTGKRADMIFTNSWSASATTKHPEAAWELIKYMTGSAVQESQLNAGFALPTLKSLANAPYFTSHPDFKVLFDSAPYGYADYYGPQDSAIHNDLATALQEVMLNKKDAQSALNDAATKINNQLQS